MQTFAILGSHPDLSLAEIEAVTVSKPTHFSSQVAVFDDLDEEPTKLQERLGGTQKFGFITGSLIRGSKNEFAEFLASQLMADPGTHKVPFGISIYQMEPATRAEEVISMQKQIGMEVKSILKSSGISSRYVTSRHNVLSSADVIKNQLIEKGAEFVLLVFEKEVLIGQTATVQDIDFWSFRDYKRPARDAKRGMLPPKLARMMINLSGVKPEESTILDPFCGSGTVLMEAALMNFRGMIGSDISEAAVKDTRKNMEWLGQQGVTFRPPTLYTSTAANLPAHVGDLSVDVIVAEPFLGDPRKGNEQEYEIREVTEHLAQLYRESFQSLEKVLKPGGAVIFASPVHFINEKTFSVPTKDVMIELGFQQKPITVRPLIYRRPGQFVGREILRFVKPLP